MLTLTGILMVCAVIVYHAIQPSMLLTIPFEDGVIRLCYGWSFWLCFAAGRGLGLVYWGWTWEWTHKRSSWVTGWRNAIRSPVLIAIIGVVLNGTFVYICHPAHHGRGHASRSKPKLVVFGSCHVCAIIVTLIWSGRQPLTATASEVTRKWQQLYIKLKTIKLIPRQTKTGARLHDYIHVQQNLNKSGCSCIYTDEPERVLRFILVKF